MDAKGGDISIDNPYQIILQRTSVIIYKEYIQCRLNINLPAKGRSIISETVIKSFK